MMVQIESDMIVLDRKFQGMCKLPFYGHPDGCPNFGKKKGCPPNQPLIDNIIDLNSEMYVIYTSFNVGEFAEKMGQDHPDWNMRQRYNPRLWQPTVRKIHRYEIGELLKDFPNFIVTRSPEANGVDITHLMGELNVKLNWEWPPKHDLVNLVYVISIAGLPAKSSL